jgi:glycosyltransferase involved in cell wall biosynthesis
LYIVDSLGLSGKTRTMVYLASHLDPKRFQAEVCTLSAEKSVLTEQLAAGNVPVHLVRCKDGLDIGAVVGVGKLIRSMHADVVHCYNPRPILYGGIAARLLGVDARIGSLSAFACQVPDRAYGFLPQPLATKSRRNVLRNQLSIHLMRCLATVSATLGKRFCEYNSLPMDKLRVVPYGADLSAVDRVTLEEAASLRRAIGFAADDVVIGSVGRLVEQKDYPTQLKAFAIAAERGPRLRMVLAGDGPLEASSVRWCGTSGSKIACVFSATGRGCPALLRSLDIFVLASKFEPFGVAILEAKAAGVAIVATRVNEIPEILSDGESGLLSPAEDPDGMARAFVMLATGAGAARAARPAREARSRAAAQSRCGRGRLSAALRIVPELNASNGAAPRRPATFSGVETSCQLSAGS